LKLYVITQFVHRGCDDGRPLERRKSTVTGGMLASTFICGECDYPPETPRVFRSRAAVSIISLWQVWGRIVDLIFEDSSSSWLFTCWLLWMLLDLLWCDASWRNQQLQHGGCCPLANMYKFKRDKLVVYKLSYVYAMQIYDVYFQFDWNFISVTVYRPRLQCTWNWRF